ncbi:MAG TPA: hypothetical protein IAB13_01570 [Candidatus Avanaerovorax faecigallinarum]|nr:hypothetical protein [Candidatus Avanaerovorax faecigallinarum]
MNIEKFTDALGEVDDKYVTEALSYKKSKRGRKYIFTFAAAACILLAVVAGEKFLTPEQEVPVLPRAGATKPDDTAEGSRAPGIGLYNFEEFESGSPWNPDADLETLPAYKNLSYHRAGTPLGLSEEEMEERFSAAANALGLEFQSREAITETYPDYLNDMKETKGVTKITGTTGDTTLTVYANGETEVIFESAIALPEKYSFTEGSTSDDEAVEALKYLYGEYSDLLGYETPAYYSTKGYGIGHDYADDEGTIENSYPVSYRGYYVYDGSGTMEDKILSHDFRYTDFIPDENGKLKYIRTYDGLSTAEKLGDYPLISLDDARSKLEEGDYICQYDTPTGEPDIINPDDISGVCLKYLYNITEEYYLPYYVFYVDGGEWEFGLHTYVPYFIPAISDEYLDGITVYDGHIN